MTERELISREYQLGHHHEQIKRVQESTFRTAGQERWFANPADHCAGHLAHHADALSFRPLREDETRVAATMKLRHTGKVDAKVRSTVVRLQFLSQLA